MDFHWMRFRATVHPTESLERVRQALGHAAGLEGQALVDAVRETRVEMHHGGTSVLLDLELRRNRDCRAALARILGPEGEGAAAFLETLPRRVDEDGVLYLRLDKQEAYQGRLVVGVFDDPVSVRTKVQVHPSNREAALAAWAAWLADRASPAL